MNGRGLKPCRYVQEVCACYPLPNDYRTNVVKEHRHMTGYELKIS